MTTKRVLVRVTRLNGADRESSSFLRGCVPELGVFQCNDPEQFFIKASERFNSLARIRKRGRQVDLDCPHVDKKKDMYLPVEIEVQGGSILNEEGQEKAN